MVQLLRPDGAAGGVHGGAAGGGGAAAPQKGGASLDGHHRLHPDPGIGNIIDRIVHGYVVDMFDLQLFSYPVFNLADCCVVVGAILGGVYYLFLYDKYDKKKKESDHAHDPSDPS